MLDVTVERFFETPSDANYFFGYFNTPQVSADGKRILALRCEQFDQVPDGTEIAEVGWFELGVFPPLFQKIGETTAYNWQQGAMLQFLGPDFNSRIIWNTFDGDNYIAEIYDLITGERQFVAAVYNPSPDGRSATTIDFSRHTWCRRGYSYGNLIDESKNKPVVPGDGIWRVDLDSGAREQIISLDEMMELSPLGTMKEATHYLEHMTFNSTGSDFAFLHRWRHANGIHSRMLVAKLDGSNVRIVNDSGRMSHYCWLDENHILGYGGLANPVNKLRRNKVLLKSLFRFALPIYKRLIRDDSPLAKKLTGDSYLIIDASGREKTCMVAPSMRAGDGHPTMLPGKRWFVTDTYARAVKNERPRLFVVDLDSDSNMLIDELDSIAEHDESPTRCDLHPRLSPSGDIISIDTMDRGVRGIYAYQLKGV